jgi:hypothetical protein
MSYSGSLIENVNSFGRNNAYGYSPNWNTNFIDMRNSRNQSNQRRHDLVGFTYHHSFGPLIPKSVLRKELQIFKEIYWKTWNGQADKSDHSKGFWPSEAAFSRHMVDVLVDEATWQDRQAQVPGPTFQREHGQGMGRELFAGMRRLVRTAEEGAVTWL